jgi:hypothetical protein
MNANDVMKYGHYTLISAIEGMPDGAWESANVCGRWTLKDVVAHLASFEQVLVEILESLTVADARTPMLNRWIADYQQFNEDEVAFRKHLAPTELLDEYHEAHVVSMDLINQIPAEARRVSGALEWYGEEYDLEDFIVYTFYGHKREHAAQISQFRDKLARNMIHDLFAV